MKQETLEEAAEDYGNSIGNKDGTAQFDFIKGAKWQQERMYSEEDLRRAYIVGKHGGVNQTYYDFDEWFEQFKKK
jgi:hypothetical protein